MFVNGKPMRLYKRLTTTAVLLFVQFTRCNSDESVSSKCPHANNGTQCFSIEELLEITNSIRMFHENKSGDIFAPQTWIDYDGCEVMTNKQDAALAEFYTRRGPEIGWRCPKPSGRIGSSFDSPITGLNCTKSLMCEYSLDCDYWDYNELCDVPLDNVPLYHRNCVAKGFMRDKAMGRESDTTICEPGLGNYSKYPGCPSTPEEVVDSTQEEAMDSTQEEATDSTQEEAVEGRPESSHAHEYYARLSFIMLVWAAFDSYGYR